MSNFVLCGPIVRRVDRQSVSVFVVTRRACEVTLDVFENDRGRKGDPRARGTARTIALGAGGGAHAVVVTAQPGTPLRWGASYQYLLSFTEGGKTVPMTADDMIVASWAGARDVHRLVYPGEELPGFTLPPEDLARVRFLHGSCRKPHGIGTDAMVRVDSLIAEALADRGDALRPQQLFLTGDQIYADDVDPTLLAALREFARDHLGLGEETTELARFGAALEPRGRVPIMNEARLSTGAKSSHLLGLAEFYAMYLLVWSPEGWRGPAAERAKAALQLDDNLPQVRRALANIATYMIFDDHEVTDDWYIGRGWSDAVLGNSLGRRIVRNALASYAVFQHWGNEPAEFAPGRPGGQALAAIDGWDGTAGRAAALDRLLPVPANGGAIASPPAGVIDWSWRWRGPTYDVVGLDSRTRRRFDDRGVSLMTEPAIDAALGTDAPKRFTVVLAATPVLGVRVLEWLQRMATRFGLATTVDAEPWRNGRSYGHLLKKLLDRAPALVLSGDVHFGFGASLFDRDAPRTRIVNLVSSAFKNAPTGWEARGLHTLHFRNDDELQAARQVIVGGVEAIVETQHELVVDDRVLVEVVHTRGNALVVGAAAGEVEPVLQGAQTRDTTDVATVSNLGDLRFLPGDHEVVHDVWYDERGTWKKIAQRAAFWMREDA